MKWDVPSELSVGGSEEGVTTRLCELPFVSPVRVEPGNWDAFRLGCRSCTVEAVDDTNLLSPDCLRLDGMSDGEK